MNLEIQVKPDTLKQLKKRIKETGTIQELIDITPQATINSPKKHYLLSRDSKLNYKPANISDVVNYNGIYFNTAFYFTLNKADVPDSKGNNYITAFKRLQDIVREILKEHAKENEFGKQLIKLSNKINTTFNIYDPEINICENYVCDNELKILNSFINSTIGLYITYKEQQENNFNYYIELSVFIPDVAEQLYIFKSEQEFKEFKQDVKEIYKACGKLLHDLIKENNKPQFAIKSYVKTVTTPNLKKFSYFTNNIKPFKQDETYNYYIIDNVIFGKSKNINFTTFDFNVITYLLIYYNDKTNKSIVNLYEFFKLSGTSNFTVFKEQVYNTCKKLLNFNYTVASIDNTDFPAGVNLVDNFNNFLKDKDKELDLLWTQGFKGSVKYQYKKLMKMELNYKYFALNKQDTTLNNIAFYLNEKFTYKTKGKYQHQQQDSLGTYNIVSVKELLAHTSIIENKNNSRNRYKDIKEILKNKLDKLENQEFIILWFLIDSVKNQIQQDIYQVKPKDIMNLYIKYYMEKTKEPKVKNSL